MEGHQDTMLSTNVTNGRKHSNNVNNKYKYNGWNLTNGHAHKDTVCTHFEDWDSSKSDGVTLNDSNISKYNDQSINNSEDADETLTNGNVYSYIENTTNDNWDLSERDYKNGTLNYHESNGLIDPGCEDFEGSRPINDSWGNEILINGQVNGDFYESKQVLQDSWGNFIESNNYQNNDYQKGHSHGKAQKNLNGYAKNNINKLENEKPLIAKPTYIPPEFEENDNLAIEVGSNFIKYDKIEVTVSGMEVPKNITSFKESGLRDILFANLAKCNYFTPTPIQKYALPIIMEGRDMIASAQTGSGKTAAFILPILNSLLSDPSELIVDCDHCEPQALIMSPTRELAIQICEVATRLSKETIIKSELLYGGTATYYQKDKILRGVHIIVATPGRLIDFVNRGLITFSSLRFFVLDEADRMLDMGFKNEIERILSNETMTTKDERTTVMFSATLPEDVQQIAKSYLKSDYVSVAVGEIGEACKDVTQKIIEVTKFNKKNELINVLNDTDDCQGTIVFVEQKRNADFIAAFLSEMNYPTTSIHGDREQPEREKALKDFKTKKMKILVATAVAARGLDIKGVTMVLNFDLPKTKEEYVHRIGRTGRLGNAGKAISFYDPEHDQAIAPYLVNILTKADQVIPEFLLQYRDSVCEPINQFNDIRKDVTVISDIHDLDEDEEW